MSSLKKQSSNNQEGSLNVLKVFATIIIILHHYQQITGASFPKLINFYGGSFYWGYMVELFFLLSGYFTYHYSKNEQMLESGFFGFIWKKYKRFLPLLIITGISAAVVIKWVTITKGTTYNYNLWTIILGLTGTGRLFTEKLVINNPTWYIHILLLCYAVFYIDVFIAKRLKANISVLCLFTVVIGIVMYHVCNQYTFSMPFFSKSIARGLICFFYGLLLFAAFDKFGFHKKALAVIASLCYVVIFIVVYIKVGIEQTDTRYYLLAFTVFPCVITCFKSRPMTKLFSFALFKNLSTVSYHTFMWHLTVMHLYINVLEICGVSAKSLPAMLGCLLATIVAGVVSAVAGKLISSAKKKNKLQEA